MLVVKEKRGRFHGIGAWKLPTGVVDAVCTFSNRNYISSSKQKSLNARDRRWSKTFDLYLQGEEIFEAAIREVKEETGVSILIQCARTQMI